MLVSEDFEAPPAAKALDEEVSVVKGWLSPPELFGATPLLAGEPLPASAVPAPVEQVGESIGESITVVGDVGSNELIVSQPLFSAVSGRS
jgi:hypothetical protein